jgi:hypothetical protein
MASGRTRLPGYVSTRTLLLVLWAFLVGVGLWFVLRYGSNVPYLDDWDIIPFLTGDQPVTAEWLWSQHNEHRVPVPRLLLLALTRVTGIDVRAWMVVNVLAMGGLALALLFAVRRVSGRWRASDVFFPIVLLSWGQAVNFLWGWQLQFFLSTVLAGLALIAIVGGRRFELPRTLLVAGCALLLPLCGGNGVALVPGLAAWLAYSAWLRLREDGARARREGVVGLGAAILALGLTVLYFVGWEPVPYHPSHHRPLRAAFNALQFVTAGLGPGIQPLWAGALVAVAVLFAVTGVLLVSSWLGRPEERRRAAGLFCFLGAMASLAFAVGFGRRDPEIRYVTLALPAWCAAYFAWTLYGPPRARRAVQAMLALAVALAFLSNTRAGIAYGSDLRDKLRGFEREMTAGAPSSLLIARHVYIHAHHDVPTDYMPLLRRAGVGAFRFLRDDPPFHEVPVLLKPAAMKDVEWRDGVAVSTSDEPSLVFDLGRDRFVAGIRLVFEYRSRSGRLPYTSIQWKRKSQPEFTERQFYKRSPTGDHAVWSRASWLRPAGPETTMIVWIWDSLAEIRLNPGSQPGTFHIREFTLLVPPE